MFITILLFILVAYLVFHCYFHYGPKGRLINKLPGPGYPIIGTLLDFLHPVDGFFKLLTTRCDTYYPIFKVRYYLFLTLVSIRHPDDLEVILNSTKHINKSVVYNLLHPWLGTGLLTSGGSKWQSRRKILTPAFHFNILQQFVEILIKEGENMTKSLKNAECIVTKDLLPFISEHTLNAICETAMGISLQGKDLFQQRYQKAVHRIGELMVYRYVRPWLLNDWIFSFLPAGREHAKLLKTLHSFTEKIIAERKDYHKQTNGQYLKNLNTNVYEDDAETIGIRKRRLALLDILIQASQDGTLSDSDIREEVDTFMFEGHDTTAMGIFYILSLLAEHKDIQDCVRKEVNAIMRESEGKLTMKSLQDMQYLERCIKEGLRLYPSVYFIMRVTSEETQLKSYLIPAGTTMHLHIYGVHRDPNFWPNPEKFDPDRFLPENIRNRHPYSYIPFSAGPRNCIGQRFALLELKAIIAPLVHNFYLEPVDYLKDIRLSIDLVLRPFDTHHLKFIPISTKCM
ncbi:cytochrome P450 4C1 isoform X2 [Solenopsis invicta]|uniref:cytochrome P450 4C1 isoform X2 n=1 Tax=Solenopsis invicta TaxID=13686 RepID=UPI00193E4A2A|nr:cytochrome P450 4C1 isoform X2 [Solenopsis invicta]XP_039304257.1 cytochrome P450 4C1 isoform X2 [Solenopsis invicta]